jgi:branched-chain amino acid transport system permease protein
MSVGASGAASPATSTELRDVAHRLRNRAPVIGPLLALALVLLLPVIGLNVFWEGQIVLMAAYVLVVSGVNVTFGYAGELALGQVGVFAVGAYVGGWLASNGFNDVVLDVLAAAAAGAFVGLLSGLPGLRIGGWALAMTSFFLVILIPDLTQIIPGIGGDVGLSAIPVPKFFGATLSSGEFMIVAVAILALWLGGFRNFIESRHGIALKMLRESRDLTAAVGSSVYRMKLVAYVGGAIPAAMGGALFAWQIQFVGPATFDFTLAIAMIAGSIVGGTDSVYGAVAGGALLEYVSFKTASFAQYSVVVYGAILLIGGVLISGGLASVGRKVVTKLRIATDVPSRESSAIETGLDLSDDGERIAGTRLEVSDVSKSFGAVEALKHVSLTAEPGQITGIIGPNGSGKTTLLNVIAGVYPPQSGSVSVNGQLLPSTGPQQHARQGIARTFQSPIIPRGLRAWEVVAAARYHEVYCSIGRTILRTPRARRLERDDYRLALATLERVGLRHLANAPATTLSLGHRRLLEVGRTLVRRSGVVLLDEAASGLDEQDIEVLAGVLRRLRDAGATIVLVEHNFPLVVELADIIYVLEFGQVISSGVPDVVQHDPVVISSYLGEAVFTDEPASVPVPMDPIGSEL